MTTHSHSGAAEAEADILILMQRTPWGRPDYIERIAPGVYQFGTPSHGGLRVTPDIWATLPEDVTAAWPMYCWAEEDSEAPIVLALLGLADATLLAHAIRIAESGIVRQGLYSALPHLRRVVPLSDPIEPFELRADADADDVACLDDEAYEAVLDTALAAYDAAIQANEEPMTVPGEHAAAQLRGGDSAAYETNHSPAAAWAEAGAAYDIFYCTLHSPTSTAAEVAAAWGTYRVADDVARDA